MSDLSERLSKLTPEQRNLLEERLRQDRKKMVTTTCITAIEGEGPWPLSHAQERLWFLDQLYDDYISYNQPLLLRLRGDLDRDALQQALSEIVRRHEVLRSNYRSDGPEPQQTIQPAQQVPLPVIDMWERTAENNDETWLDLAISEARKPFDLEQDLMLRAVLYRLGDQDFRLLLVLHHIATDGWSSPILMRELSILYSAARSDQPANLPDLPVQYKDFAVWQKSEAQRAETDRQLAYWHEQLQGLPPLELPGDRPPGAEIVTSARTVRFKIPADIANALDDLGRYEKATRYMVLLSAFFVLLQRYCGQDDISVGTPVANRQSLELEKLIGFFVNMLVIRGDLSGRPSFRELLQRIRSVTIEALQHQNLPYEQLIAALQPERHMNRNPLFQVAFQVTGSWHRGFELEGLDVQNERIEYGIGKFDLDVAIVAADEGWKGSWHYSTDIFDDATAERMVGHYLELLAAIADDPDEAISALPLMSAAERQKILYEWNDTAVPYPRDSTVHDLFSEQVRQTPHNPALHFAGETVTYGELERRTNKLAHYLIEQGVKPGDLVGFALERSFDLIAAMLAILKAGGAYVPLDTGYPRERLAGMIEDAHCSVILSTSDHREKLPDHDGTIIYLDDHQAKKAIDQQPEITPSQAAEALDPAYVIFTSGSTGRPKGTIVPHRAVVRLVKNTNYADLGPEQRFLQFAPVSFDAATLEIWGPLLNGGQLFIYRPGLSSLADLADALREYEITCLFLTSGLFHQMVEYEAEALASVAQVLSGGDVVSASHARRLLQAGGICHFSNVYGPTENTTFTTFYPTPDIQAVPDRLPIGKPIHNSTVYILDAGLQPVPIGVPGDLYIGGDGLALGYLNRPELTAQSFIANPFSAEAAALLYRTGDRARYLADGNIDFLGRADRQMKVRGFRIEPGEIESCLTGLEGVQQAVVILDENEVVGKRLLAYVVPEHGETPQENVLKKELATVLPNYMIPATIMTLEALPLDPNGKIDRSALPRPDGGGSREEVAEERPLTEAEAVLTAIWREVLDMPEATIHANFFDAGGHSLLGIRFLALIEERHGVTLPVKLLFQTEQIADLAPYFEHVQMHVDDEKADSGMELLVPFREAGSRAPFFCVHGFGGGVFDYRYLADHMDADQPFYAIQAVGMNGDEEPDQSIEEMAARYVRAIRALQPQGPYNVGGYCSGGVVAYEMARLLAAEGQETAVVAVIEGYAPVRGSRKGPNVNFDYLSTILRHIPYWVQDYAGLGLARFRRSIQIALRRHLRKMRGGSGANVGRRLEDLSTFNLVDIPEQRQYLMRVHLRALGHYNPQPYDGRVTVFRSRKRTVSSILFRGDDPTNGWSALARGGVDVREVDGGHDSLHLEPYVSSLAESLAASIKKAGK